MLATSKIIRAIFLILIVIFVLCFFIFFYKNKRDGDILFYTYAIVNKYPHDQNAFTQGLVYHSGYIYEGTGRYGYSTLRKVDLKTGEIIQLYKLPDKYFGEGITIRGNRIIQLTFKSGSGFVYDKDSLNLLQEFQYPNQGWGITNNGTHLIMSDGSATLYFLSPETFKKVFQIVVRDSKGPVKKLNELEYINGEIFANIWKSNRIARIDPDTGKVVGWVDLTGILNASDKQNHVDVLNGIAYDSANDRLFVTGKLWPILFEIELISEND